MESKETTILIQELAEIEKTIQEQYDRTCNRFFNSSHGLAWDPYMTLVSNGHIRDDGDRFIITGPRLANPIFQSMYSAIDKLDTLHERRIEMKKSLAQESKNPKMDFFQAAETIDHGRQPSLSRPEVISVPIPKKKKPQKDVEVRRGIVRAVFKANPDCKRKWDRLTCEELDARGIDVPTKWADRFGVDTWENSLTKPELRSRLHKMFTSDRSVSP